MILEVKIPEDLLLIFQQLKMVSARDSVLDLYSKTDEDVEKIKKLEGFTNEEIEVLKTCSRAIRMNGRIYSIVLTTDDYHGFQWHVSIVEILGPSKYSEISEEVAKSIMNVVFSKWTAIDNPGKMKEIKHFVGND